MNVRVGELAVPSVHSSMVSCFRAGIPSWLSFNRLVVLNYAGYLPDDLSRKYVKPRTFYPWHPVFTITND